MYKSCVRFRPVVENLDGSEAAQTFDLHIIVVVVVVKTPHWREGEKGGIIIG